MFQLSLMTQLNATQLCATHFVLLHFVLMMGLEKLAPYDLPSSPLKEPGGFELWVGSDSISGLQGNFSYSKIRWIKNDLKRPFI